MKLDLLVKLKYESSTIILFIGIKYSMRDLLYDLNNYVLPVNWRYASDTLNDVSASSGISSPWQAVTSIKIYVKISFISIFYLLFWFSNMILSDALILPILQLQTWQVMKSQIRSLIEYLIRTDCILVLIL